jgi:hypothetical protein
MTYSVKTVFRNVVSLNGNEDGRKYDHSIVEQYDGLSEEEISDVLKEFLDVNPNEPVPAISDEVDMPAEIKLKIIDEYKLRYDKFTMIKNELQSFFEGDETERSYSMEYSDDSTKQWQKDVVEDTITIMKRK